MKVWLSRSGGRLAVLTLMSSDARSLLDESGCRDVKGDWPVQASDRVEVVLEAVGLRG